jgi:predicted lipid-binding transport protein (Tim44 family)
MLSLLFFLFITIYLLKILNELIGIDVGFKIEKEHLNNDYFENEERKREGKKSIFGDDMPTFNPEDFLAKAKRAFEIIFKAYAEGDKDTLNALLSANMYKAFAMAIDDRNNRKEVLCGTIERFVEAEIVDTGVRGDDLFVVVKFVTEQSNVLKTQSGEILEGSPDFIESRTEIFSFFRNKSSKDERWILCEIKENDI